MSEQQDTLRRLEQAHRDLLEAFPGSGHEQAIRDILATMAKELAQLGPELVSRRPSPSEWSAQEVMEHVLAHDSRHDEARTKGVGHYVAHGKDHIEQLVQIRLALKGGQ